MKIIVEIETKLNYDGTLEYVNEECYGPYDDAEITKKYNELVNACISRGYFDKVQYQDEHYTALTNGGTAYKQFRINTLRKC